MFDRVDFAEIESAHAVQLLVTGSSLNGDGLFDKVPSLLRQTVWPCVRHVDNRVGRLILLTEPRLGDA